MSHWSLYEVLYVLCCNIAEPFYLNLKSQLKQNFLSSTSWQAILWPYKPEVWIYLYLAVWHYIEHCVQLILVIWDKSDLCHAPVRLILHMALLDMLTLTSHNSPLFHCPSPRHWRSGWTWGSRSRPPGARRSSGRGTPGGTGWGPATRRAARCGGTPGWSPGPGCPPRTRAPRRCRERPCRAVCGWWRWRRCQPWGGLPPPAGPDLLPQPCF